MVTPFMLRALTSRPSGKCNVIFLTLGMHNGRARYAGSSTVDGDLFSFLQLPISQLLSTFIVASTQQTQPVTTTAERGIELTTLAFVSRARC